jgi:hypothetical protein
VRAAARRTATATLSAILLAAGVAACGSGSSPLSAAQYRSKLTAACAAASAATSKLPAEQLRAHLTITQLRHRADEIGATFRSTVQSLRPPASLRADQQRLLAITRRTEPGNPTIAQTIVAAERVRAVYVQIGVPRCMSLIGQSIARLRRR